MQLALCSSPRLTREHTGASRREADEGPTQRMLSRPAEEKENGRPTKIVYANQEKTMTNKHARDDRASVLRKWENNDARWKKKAPR